MKVFEKIIYDQLYEYMENFLSELLRDFRKTHALLRLLQKWQADLDLECYFGTTLMDLSKAYDCLSHDVLIGKLEPYGLD